MKFTILRNDLAAALSAILGAIEIRQTLPILSHVLIEADGDGLMLTGTNLEIELQASAKATVERGGRVTVQAKKLYDIVRNLPEGADIRAEFEGMKALVRCGRSRFTLPALSADEYPRIDDRGLEGGVSFELAEGDLKRTMQRVSFAMANNDVRMYLNGMLLHLKGGEIRAVAASSISMGIATLPVEGLPAGETEIILPAKSAQEIQKVLADADTKASVRMSRTQFQVQTAACRITTKAIDGRFPDYERVMALDTSCTLTIEREPLKRALARVGIVAHQQSRAVRLTMQADSIALSSAASQNEEGEDHVDASLDGANEFEIGFAVNAIADVLTALPGERVVMRFENSMKHAQIASADGAGGRYVVMPMRL